MQAPIPTPSPAAQNDPIERVIAAIHQAAGSDNEDTPPKQKKSEKRVAQAAKAREVRGKYKQQLNEAKEKLSEAQRELDAYNYRKQKKKKMSYKKGKRYASKESESDTEEQSSSDEDERQRPRKRHRRLERKHSYDFHQRESTELRPDPRYAAPEVNDYYAQHAPPEVRHHYAKGRDDAMKLVQPEYTADQLLTHTQLQQQHRQMQEQPVVPRQKLGPPRTVFDSDIYDMPAVV